MFRVHRIAPVFIIIIYWSMRVSDQKSLSYGICRLTNTCFGRTTKDLANERSTTPKIIDKAATSDTQTTSAHTGTSTLIATNTLGTLQTNDKPSTESTCSSKTTRGYNTTLHTTTSIYTTIQVTEATNKLSEALTEASETATTSTTARTTANAMKTTEVSKESNAYSTRLVEQFSVPLCDPSKIVKLRGLICILCFNHYSDGKATLRANEDSIPYDLLMLTATQKIKHACNMVAIKSTDTIYVIDGACKCIWKIDIYRNRVTKWMSNVGYCPDFSVTSENHLLLLRRFRGRAHLKFYDQDAKLLTSVSLSKDFGIVDNAFKKPDGEFIIAQMNEGTYPWAISILSPDWQIIHQFILQYTTNGNFFYFYWDIDSHILFVDEMFGGDMYLFEWDTFELSRFDSISVKCKSQGVKNKMHYDENKKHFIRIRESNAEMLALIKY